MNRLRAWGVPGFRRGTAWRSMVAVLGYAVVLFLFLLALFQPFAAVIYLAAALAFVILVTDGWGVGRRLRGPQGSVAIIGFLDAILLAVGGVAWVAGTSAGAPPKATPVAVGETGAAQPSAVAGAAPAQAAPTPRPPTAAQAAQTASAQATAGAAPLVEAARAEAVALLGQAVSRREAGELGIALELGRQALGKWPGNPEAQSFLATVQPQATAQVRDAIAQATAQAQAAAVQAAAAATAAASQPITLSGQGARATDPITPRSAQNVARFTHRGSRNFQVYVFRGTQRDLLVNHIGPYDGQRPILGEQPFALGIEADGAWTVDIRPIAGGGAPSFSGRGDAVSSSFSPPQQGPWEFRHDGARNYQVYLYCGGSRQLVQNRIGPFEGSQILGFGRSACFWEVHADGSWSLQPRQ